ncbi:hypothetical protein [Rickettsia hoogstraalii]|nr:hypothetical protein [Rickettsia hoogstraalii]
MELKTKTVIASSRRLRGNLMRLLRQLLRNFPHNDGKTHKILKEC